MNRNHRYTAWLEIADELVALHEFAYGAVGPFAQRRDKPLQSTGLSAAIWIKNKCATGKWYWWDKTTLAGKALDPIRSFQHVISDSGGYYEETEAGRELIARMERIESRVAAASRN